MKYRAEYGFDGIKIEDAPNGFIMKVSYGCFNNENEARFSSNHGNWFENNNNEDKTINVDILEEFFYDDGGFGLEVVNANNETRILRVPEIDIEVRKYDESLDLAYEELPIWDIDIHKLGLEIPYSKKRVFDSLFFDSKKDSHKT